MALLQVSLILSSFLGCALAQAPHDGNYLCVDEVVDGGPNTFFSTRPSYPASVWPLMDSRDYMSLLLGDTAVWQHVDSDTNNQPALATNVS